MKKIFYIFFAFAIGVLISGCARRSNGKVSKEIWKGEPSQLLTKDEVKQETEIKIARVKNFLKENNLAGILLTQVRNFYWMTAGTADNQIVLNKDVGAASLLIMNDGRKYLICSESEAGLLMDEALSDLGYQLKEFPWYEANSVKDVRGKIIREIAGTGRVGSDINYPGTELVADKFAKLRYQLTNTEIKRYKWLGEQTTEAVSDVCRKLMPGMNEYEIEAMTSASLRSRGIMPTVLLIAVNDRIYKYRHALPVGDTLKDYAMVNVVAEKWGMPIAVTRFVHFGKLPKNLEENIKKAAVVNAHYEEATKPGTSIEKIFEECQQWYASVGFNDEWKNHHQGGAIGYNDREYILYPGNSETVLDHQAFAWNPTVPGSKVEETLVAYKDSTEVITKSKNWPMINVELYGKIYPQPAILLKDPQTGKIIDQPVVTINARDYK